MNLEPTLWQEFAMWWWFNGHFIAAAVIVISGVYFVMRWLFRRYPSFFFYEKAEDAADCVPAEPSDSKTGRNSS